MARLASLGFEYGDWRDVAIAGDANWLIESTVVTRGGYSAKRATSATQSGFTSKTGLNLTRIYSQIRFRVNSIATPSSDCGISLFEFKDSGGNNLCAVYITQAAAGGAWQFTVFNAAFSAQDNISFTVAADTWYCVEADFTKGAGTGAINLYVDGVSIASLSSKQYGSANIDQVFHGWQSGGVQSRTFYFDDLALDDSELCGQSYIVARHSKSGTPTYDAWEKSNASTIDTVWESNPFSTTNHARSYTSGAAQTALVSSFSATQTGHGTGTISASDVIKGVKVGMTAKTYQTDALGIAIRGTAQGGNAINGGNVTLTFDVTPLPGDVVLLMGASQNRAGFAPAPSGYTQIAAPTTTNNKLFVWKKVMGYTPDTTAVVNGSGSTQDVTVACAIVLKNVNNSVIEDATFTTANNTTGAPDPASITVTMSGVWVVTFSCSHVNDATVGTSSGGALRVQTSNTDTNPMSAAISSSQAGGAGAVDHGAYGGWTSAEWLSVTCAIRLATEAMTAASIRRRVGGSDTDTAITLTTSDALYETPIFTATLTNINASEMGVLHGSHSSRIDVEDILMTVDYIPATARTMPVTAGAYSMGGVAAGGLRGLKAQVTTGAYSMAGTGPARLWTRLMPVSTGGYVMFATGPALARGKGLIAAAGAYVWAGVAAGAAWLRRLPVTTGSYLMGGVGPGIGRTRLMSVVKGVYTMTGVGPGTFRGLKAIVTTGAYVWSGIATGARFWTRRLPVTTGAYVWSGVASGLRVTHLMPVATAAYVWSGKATGLLRGKAMAITRGLYTMTGTGPAFTPWHRVLTVTRGLYSISGIGPTGRQAIVMSVTRGIYVMAGQAVGLIESVRRFVAWGRMIRLDRERDD